LQIKQRICFSECTTKLRFPQLDNFFSITSPHRLTEKDKALKLNSMRLHVPIHLILLAGFLAAPAQGKPEDRPLEPIDVNHAMGLRLWDQEVLWEEDADTVAGRAGWKEESKTSTSSSYRKYPFPAEEVFGRKAYSLSLHGAEGKAAAVSIIFANKGDVERMFEPDPTWPDHRIKREAEQFTRNYQRVVQEDFRSLSKTLEELFGQHSTERLGASRQTTEQARRWDWQGHTFLLSSPNNEFTVLRIIPTEEAGPTVGVERIAKNDLREELAGRVVREENGDVMITEIPMVDQGPKGYCVPATWERVLRYMGIPADMNVLAMAGDTGVGGGTSTTAIATGANMLIQRHGRRLASSRGRINASTLAPHIDRGLPIMWTMYVVPEINELISSRTRERKQVTDWEEWKKSLDPFRRAARQIKTERDAGHVCMIIGYNRQTGEVAVSDSWGPAFALRWMTMEEAEAVSQGEFQIIQP